MNFDEKGAGEGQTTKSHRRGFLLRNLAAIGAIASQSLPGRASAHDGPEPHGGNDWLSFGEGGGKGRGGRGRGRGGKGGGENHHGGGGGGGGGPKCFLKGATIRTVDGDRKVEDLRIGDRLPGVFGGVQVVQWVGHFSYRRSDAAKPWVNAVLPVRIARGAIAPGVPKSDLYVSSGHCLYLDGMLIPAGNLVNSATIRYEAPEGAEQLEYFHIKLAHHDVIFAEDAPCETLLAVDERAANFAEYYRLYGEHQGEEAPCAPIMQYRGRRGMIVSRLRSAVSPWIDLRADIDIVRDCLEERALWLS